MAQVTRDSFGPRNYASDTNASNNAPGACAQDAVPALYPAIGPSKTLDTVSGPATLFVSGDPGTFTISGNSSGIIVHRELAGQTGTYVLTGNDGVTRLTHKVAGATGVYTETGSAAGIIVARRLLGGTGTFAETGNAAGIIVHRELSGGTGVFTETGSDGLFKLVTVGTAQYNLAGETGVFAVVGNDGQFQLVARPEPEGGISGYLKREKGYSRLGGNVMVQTMGEATERAEKIMLGWRDDEEALLVIQIIQNFYD